MSNQVQEVEAVYAGMHFYSWVICHEKEKYWPRKKLRHVIVFLRSQGFGWAQIKKQFTHNWDWRKSFRAIPLDGNESAPLRDFRLAQCFELGIRLSEYMAVWDGGGLGMVLVSRELQKELRDCLLECGDSDQLPNEIPIDIEKLLDYDDEADRVVAVQTVAVLHTKEWGKG